MKKISSFRFQVCVFALVAGIVSVGAQAAETVQLIGVGQFSGTASDLSGQADKLENGEPHNRLGGFSALEYSGEGNRYVALPDRGPDDGATGYLCRFQWLDIDVNPAAAEPVKLKLVQSVFLKDKQGRPFTGASTAFTADDKVAGRLDPEGFRFGHKGHFFLSDEYGPHLIEFTAEGTEVRRFALPDHLTVKHPADSKEVENQLNSIGRSSNKGMEGLGISSDRNQLFGIMQQVLLQDGERKDGGKPIGINCRLVVVDATTGAEREYVYQLDDKENGLNEIVSIGDHQFLVIERDGEIGDQARFKKIMKIDLTDATEVQDIASLPAFELPSTIRPVRKETFIDFLAAEHKLTPDLIPEKLEGLTFGKPLSDGRPTLVVSSDNDFNAESPSLIYVFAMPKESPGSQAVSVR